MRQHVLRAVLEHQRGLVPSQRPQQYVLHPGDELVPVPRRRPAAPQQPAQQHLRQVGGLGVRQHRALHQPHDGQRQRGRRQVHRELYGPGRGRGPEARHQLARRPYRARRRQRRGRMVGQHPAHLGRYGPGGEPGQEPGPRPEGGRARRQHRHRQPARGPPGQRRPVRPEGEGLPAALRPGERAPLGGQPAAPPQPLRQRLDDHARGALGPPVEQPLRRSLAPQRPGAVGDHHGQGPAGRVPQLVPGAQAGGAYAAGCGAASERGRPVHETVQIVHLDVAEGAQPFAHGAQFLEHVLPDGHRRGRVHHQPYGRLAPALRPEYGNDQSESTGAGLGGGRLVDHQPGGRTGRAVPLEGAQGPLDVQDAGQRGGPGHPYGHSVLLGRLPGPLPVGAVGTGRPGRVEPDRGVAFRVRAYGPGGPPAGSPAPVRASPGPGPPGRACPGPPMCPASHRASASSPADGSSPAARSSTASSRTPGAPADATADHLGRSRRWMSRSARSSRVGGAA